MRRCLCLVAVVAVSASPPSERASAPAASSTLDYLNQAVAWYRGVAAMAAVAANPAEVLVHNDARQTALEVLRLAFPFARAQVDLLPPAPVPPPSAPSGGIDPQTLARLAAEAAARLKQAQAGIERIQRELAPAPPGRRATLQRQLAEARAELQLAKARQGTMDAFTSFTARQGVGAGLLEQIDGLERSVPELQANAGKTALPAERAAAGRSQDGGVLALSGDLLSLVRKRREVQDERRSTDALRDAAGRLSAPLVADLRTASQEGDRLTLAERSNNLTVLGERTRRIEEVTSHFKKVSDALVPLAKQSVLLDAFEGHLSAWDKLIDRQLGSDLRGLLLRFALVALGIAAVLAASDVWRRATFRYVHDARRRRQFLLLRRIVVTGAVVLFIAFSFATELGSLATFAGFITAGLAIALQNVILSVVAYFFLIGKYGVRVRDRVQISGVTGDVIDVGLVRLHLMEIGPDGQPTGRVIVFSNAVLFQPTANFFKQLPGSNFTWHTVTLTFSPESDYRLAESRLLSSVEAVYEKYRASIEAQHQRVSEDLFVQLAALKPQSHLRLTAAGLEMIIRFPVPLDKASSIDDEVTRALLDAIEREPKLKLAGSAIPTISAAGAQSAAAH